MNSNTALLLGMVKIKHPEKNYTEMIEVNGFDVIGLFLPIIRLIGGGFWKLTAFFLCGGFIFYPVWCWYLGFNFKKMRFEKKLKEGWSVVEN